MSSAASAHSTAALRLFTTRRKSQAVWWSFSAENADAGVHTSTPLGFPALPTKYKEAISDRVVTPKLLLVKIKSI